MQIKIKKLKPNATIPSKGSQFSAGFDLHACITNSIKIEPGSTVKIPTGFALEIPNGYAGFVFARSGLATKSGLAPANKVGVCDSDYRGEYVVAIHNHGKMTIEIKPNERIAQLIFIKVSDFNFVEVEELSETERNDKGFGSTGR